jgi:class 3 adenylate cyclase
MTPARLTTNVRRHMQHVQPVRVVDEGVTVTDPLRLISPQGDSSDALLANLFGHDAPKRGLEPSRLLPPMPRSSSTPIVENRKDPLPAANVPRVLLPQRVGGKPRANEPVPGPQAIDVHDRSIFDPTYRAHIAHADYDTSLAMSPAGGSSDYVKHGVKGALHRIDGILTAMYRQQRFLDGDASRHVALPSATTNDVDATAEHAKSAEEEVHELKTIVGVLVREAANHREAMAAVELNEQKFHQSAKEMQAALTSAHAQLMEAKAEVARATAARDAAVDDKAELLDRLEVLKQKGAVYADDDDLQSGLNVLATETAELEPAFLEGATSDNQGSFTLANSTLSATSMQAPTQSLLPSRYYNAPRRDTLTFVVLGVQGHAALMESVNAEMPMALATLHTCIANAVRQTSGCLVKRTDDNHYVIAFVDAVLAVHFGLTLQLDLVDQCWPQQLEASADAGRVEDEEQHPIWAGLRVRIGIEEGPARCEGDPLQPNAIEYVGDTVQQAQILCRIACGGMIATSGKVAAIIRQHADDLQHPSVTVHCMLTSAIESRDVYCVLPVPLVDRLPDFQRIIAQAANHEAAAIPGHEEAAEDDSESQEALSPSPSHLVPGGGGGGGRISELEMLLGRVRNTQTSFRPVPTSEGLIPSEKLVPENGVDAVKKAALPSGRVTLVCVRVSDADYLSGSYVEEEIKEAAFALINGAIEEGVAKNGGKVWWRPTMYTRRNEAAAAAAAAGTDAASPASPLPTSAGAMLPNASFGLVPNASFIEASTMSFLPSTAPKGATGLQWIAAIHGDLACGVQCGLDIDAALLAADWPRELLSYSACHEIKWKGSVIQRGPRACIGVHQLERRDAAPHFDCFTGTVRYIGESVLIASRLCELAQGGFTAILDDHADLVLVGVAERPAMYSITVPMAQSRAHAGGQRKTISLLAPRPLIGRYFVLQGMVPYSVWRGNEAYRRLRAELERQDGKWAKRLSCISLTAQPTGVEGLSFDDTTPVPPSMPYGAEPPRLTEDFRLVLALTRHFARAAHRCPTSLRGPTIAPEQAMRQMESLEAAAMAMLDASLGGTVIELPMLAADLPSLRGFLDAERSLVLQEVADGDDGAASSLTTSRRRASRQKGAAAADKPDASTSRRGSLSGLQLQRTATKVMQQSATLKRETSMRHRRSAAHDAASRSSVPDPLEIDDFGVTESPRSQHDTMQQDNAALRDAVREMHYDAVEISTLVSDLTKALVARDSERSLGSMSTMFHPASSLDDPAGRSSDATPTAAALRRRLAALIARPPHQAPSASTIGTTYSCVGVWQNDRVEIIANDQGNRTTPSYVAFTDTERLIGDAAKNQAAMNPTNTVFDAKRLIGRKFSDSVVQADIKHWPFKIVHRGDDKPLIEVSFKGETSSSRRRRCRRWCSSR